MEDNTVKQPTQEKEQYHIKTKDCEQGKNSLYSKLLAVHNDVNDKIREKNQKIKILNWDFFSWDYLRATIQPILHKYSLVCTISMKGETKEVVRKSNTKGDIMYSLFTGEMTLTIANADTRYESLSFTHPVAGMDANPAFAIGKASTYGSRYMYINVFGVGQKTKELEHEAKEEKEKEGVKYNDKSNYSRV